MDDEHLTHEELKERLRTGWQLLPDTPGLLEAARELMQPIIEGMRDKEIIYRCRVPWLDDEGFAALSTPLLEVPDGMFSMEMPQPFEFGAAWEWMHMNGSAVQANMVTDHFFPAQDVVAQVKAAVARSAKSKEIGW